MHALRHFCEFCNKDLKELILMRDKELKEMLEVCNLEKKFRIIFLVQTGMRISDALELKVGDVLRELELGWLL